MNCYYVCQVQLFGLVFESINLINSSTSGTLQVSISETLKSVSVSFALMSCLLKSCMTFISKAALPDCL